MSKGLPWWLRELKCLPAMRDTWVWSLGWEDPLEKETATNSSILAWEIPWTEKPGGLQSMGSQRVGHDRAASLNFTLWPRENLWSSLRYILSSSSKQYRLCMIIILLGRKRLLWVSIHSGNTSLLWNMWMSQYFHEHYYYPNIECVCDFYSFT